MRRRIWFGVALLFQAKEPLGGKLRGLSPADCEGTIWTIGDGFHHLTIPQKQEKVKLSGIYSVELQSPKQYSFDRIYMIKQG